MRILGIDPGYAITGFGIIETKKGKTLAHAHGVLRTQAGLPIEQRLKCIYEGLLQIIQEHRIEVVAVEELFFARNTTTAMGTAQARGIVLLAAAQRNCPVFEYTPMQVKQAVTGYGRAEKIQVQKMVQKILNLPAIPKPDDAADGLAVALCQAQMGLRNEYRAVSGYHPKEKEKNQIEHIF